MAAWEPAGRGGVGPESAAADCFFRLCSYYPLYPPQEDMAIDYDNFYSYAQLPVTPDVFVIPSELRYFVKASLNSAFSQTGQNQSSVFPSRPPSTHSSGSADRHSGLMLWGRQQD